MKNAYINLSIFYNQNEWHNLLAKCIRPLIERLILENNLVYYFIYLNKERGDNIRITIVIESAKAEHVIKILDTAINRYLVEYPSPECAHKNEGNEFFLDFKNNTIRCNLYHKRVLLADDNFEKIILLPFFLSKSILNYISDDQISGEGCFSFAMYLLFALIKCYSPRLSEAENIVEGLLTSLRDETRDMEIKGVSELQKAEIEELFGENRDIFIEICHDVWNSQKISIDLGWLVEWDTLLISHIIKEYTLIKFYVILYNMLAEHLGIKVENKILTLIVIFKTLKVAAQSLE